MEDPKVRKDISSEYKEFWSAANRLTDEDIKLYPLEKRESKRDRLKRHLLSMLEMYSIRYADTDQRLQIVDFLEKQLFRVPPIKGEVCQLTLDMWKDLRETVLSNKYRDLRGS